MINEATGIDPRGRLGNWDTPRFTAGGVTYRIRLGFDPANGFEINYFDKAQAGPPR